MKYALISEEQIKHVKHLLNPVKGSHIADNVLTVIDSLKPSSPVAWKKTINGSEITRSAKVATELGFTVQLYALDEVKK